MSTKYILFLFLLLPVINFSNSPKREFRGVWIASVFNIDWPSSSKISADLQQEEMIALLDEIEAMNFNAAILQIKPTSDAFYQSKLSPWSRYLTGTQGKNPQYDPLQLFITEAQKRNIETHVWVNPFRILNGEDWDTLCPKHIARKNPDWVIEYGGRYYFDPGNTDVQDYIIKEIQEIVKNYDFDVLHMDDYFYPYKIYKEGKLILFDDDKSYQLHKKNFQSRDDWRRENVNIFVKNLHTEIKKIKPHVRFGISPFGVWRNKSVDPKGSDTKAGQTNYDDLYADVLLWMQEGWIDYIMPQIYWHTDSKAAPYDILVKWWAEHTPSNVHLYIGLGIYKLHEQNWPRSHIKEQVEFARQFPEVDGFTYYSAQWLIKNTKNITELVSSDLHNKYRFIPHYPSNIKAKAPHLVRFDEDENSLTWRVSHNQNYYYALYRKRDKQVDLIAIHRDLKNLKYKISEHQENDRYGIQAFTRSHHASGITFTNPITIKNTEIAPNDGQELISILQQPNTNSSSL